MKRPVSKYKTTHDEECNYCEPSVVYWEHYHGSCGDVSSALRQNIVDPSWIRSEHEAWVEATHEVVKHNDLRAVQCERCTQGMPVSPGTATLAVRPAQANSCGALVA